MYIQYTSPLCALYLRLRLLGWLLVPCALQMGLRLLGRFWPGYGVALRLMYV